MVNYKKTTIDLRISRQVPLNGKFDEEQVAYVKLSHARSHRLLSIWTGPRSCGKITN